MSLEQKRYFQSGISHERERIMSILGDLAQKPSWDFKDLFEQIESEDPGDARTEEVAILRIKKVFYYEEPAHWEVDVIDHEGLEIGSATAPNFSGVFDSAYDILAGSSDDEYNSPNPWVDYDANKNGSSDG